MSVTRLETKRGPDRSVAILEPAFGGFAMGLIIWSLLATMLAQLGLFRLWILLVAGLVAGLAGLAFLRGHRPQARRESRREMATVAALVLASTLLFAWPAEHFPLLGDSAIYPNTAEQLARTGRLTYHFAPLDGLTPEQKQLFYVPADKQLRSVQIKSYRGLLYGAYYLTDTDANTITSSRPTLTIAWMALFAMPFGARGMLYLPPLFGVLSVVMLFMLGKRLFSARAGALAAVWLLLSFPLLHFARAPYAEAIGLFFILATLYGLATYRQTRRAGYLVMAALAFTAAFAARIDALMMAGGLLFYVLILLQDRDWKGLALGSAGLIFAAGFSYLTMNRPYVGATVEIFSARQLGVLAREVGPAFLLVLLGLSLAWFLLRRAESYRRLAPRAIPALRWSLSLLLLAGLAYGLHIRPLIPEYMAYNSGLIPSHNEELMAIAAQYLGAPLFWLAAIGGVFVIWRYPILSDQGLLLVLLVSIGGVLFSQYTSARIYPVAMRRLLPEVMPALMLLAAYAIGQLVNSRVRYAYALRMALAGLVVVILVSVSGRYWPYPEARGTWDFTEELAQRFPANAMILFEPQQGDAVVGWFAAPLWSFHDRNALLLNKGELDAAALQGAVCRWQQAERPVYVVAQTDPETWWPGHFTGQRDGEANWRSGIIGQSLLFPPFIWQFDFIFPIYRLAQGECPA